MSASTSPIPYTGNKSCIVKTILDVMPPHDTYIEPSRRNKRLGGQLTADDNNDNDNNNDPPEPIRSGGPCCH